MNLILQQTKIEPILKNTLKNYAQDNGLKQQELYTNAVKCLINEIDQLSVQEKSRYIFFASPIKGDVLNIKIPEQIKDKAFQLSVSMNTTARRFYYTALVKHAISLSLINSTEELK